MAYGGQQFTFKSLHPVGQFFYPSFLPGMRLVQKVVSRTGRRDCRRVFGQLYLLSASWIRQKRVPPEMKPAAKTSVL